MVRRTVYALALLLLPALIAIVIWRNPAPKWDGSPLQLTQEGEQEFDLLLFGDSGTGLPEQFQVADALERYCLNHHVAAVFMLGDNFYPQGVKSPDDSQWQSKFRDPYEKPCLSQIPFYAILGNHDYKGRPAAQIVYSQQQTHWHMPHRFYSVQFGNLAKVIAIDTGIPDLCGSSTHCSLDFMREAIRDQSIPVRIVIGHHPIASSSAKYGPSLLGWVLKQMLCKQGVSYISGHSHHLEYRQDPDCSLDLFVSGGGGAPLYPVRAADADTRFVQSTHGFLSLSVTKEQSTFTFFDSQLHKLYSYDRSNHAVSSLKENKPRGGG